MVDQPEQQEVFRRSAHSFKGASGIFGLSDLVRLSMELEMGPPVRSPRDPSQADRLRELRCRFQEALPALRSVRRQLQSRT
jgi:HPt (histidine-containing phosphotransfer) domain-containing protein